MSNIFKNIAKSFLYAALLSPLILAQSLFFPFINGKVILFRVCVELAFLFFVLYLVLAKRLPSRKFFLQPMVLSVSLFGLLFLFTTLTGVRPLASFWSNFERGEGAFQMLHYITLFLLTAFLFNTPKEWRRFLTFSLSVSVLVSIYGFFQWLVDHGFHISSIIATGRTSGTLGNPSYLAPYLLFNLLFLVWILLEEKTKAMRWVWIAVLVFELFIFFTTRTLAAIIGLLTAILILIIGAVIKIYQAHKENYNSKLFFYASYLASFLIVLLFAGSVYYFSGLNLYDRIKPRFWTWGSAISGIIERPIIGSGAESFSHVFDKYYNPNHFGGESWFDRTHNLFLEYSISGGILLLVSYLAIFIIYYWLLFKLPKTWFWWALLATVVAYLIQGLTLFDVLPVYLVLLTFLAFFANYYQNFNWSKDFPKELKGGYVVASLVGAVTIFLVYFGNYLPLRKNLILSNALRTQNIVEAINQGNDVLNFYSPIGQQEAYESFGRNFVIYLESIAQKKTRVDPNNPYFKEIMKIDDFWFDQIKPNLFGIKDFYLHGLWNLAAFRVTGDATYFNKAAAILFEAYKFAPQRMEVIVSLLDVARIGGSKQLEQELLNKIKVLRPDLLHNFGG